MFTLSTSNRSSIGFGMKTNASIHLNRFLISDVITYARMHRYEIRS